MRLPDGYQQLDNHLDNRRSDKIVETIMRLNQKYANQWMKNLFLEL